MSNANQPDFDRYEHYEDLYNPAHSERKAHRQRKPRLVPPNLYTRPNEIGDVAEDLTGLEGGFETTYTPSKHENGWLLQSLRTFYDQGVLTDVLASVKGGKEASVYRCAADPDTGYTLVAAKVYRPRMFRQLRNDAMYRKGRQVLTTKGKPVGLEAERVDKAIERKSSFGLHAAHTSWLMYEFTTLEKLYAAGGAVPKPIAVGENAILMEYIGDAHGAAPLLSEVRLDPDEVQPLFHETLRNIELLLRQGYVHGDLSAYNILYWEGAITLIDFPQVVQVGTNADARFILERDVTRVCEYFARQGLEVDAAAIANDLWRRYTQQLPTHYQEADHSRHYDDEE